MTIKSVNIAMGASYGAYSRKLTPETKAKLLKYGIPFSENTTESNGQALLRSFEASKKQELNQQSSSNNAKSQSDLFEKAKKLAQKIGVSVDENIQFHQLVIIIQQVLEQKISASENNITALKELRGYSQELADIQALGNGSSGYDNTNQALMMSLEMLSEYNKNFFKNS